MEWVFIGCDCYGYRRIHEIEFAGSVGDGGAGMSTVKEEKAYPRKR